ncbi:hypothetical protein GOODEAATRI_020758, partial [Goodea atripinnis]
AWAVASGKINEFPNDKARWKTNFRCALNNLSLRFKMIKDNSKNQDDPHKIYEIINTDFNPAPVLSSPPQPSLCDLEISIHYRKKEMLKTTLHTNRLQLHYHSKEPEFNAFHLCFPSTDGLLDHKQVVPLICRYFHDMAQMEGASSLHSANVSLQISHNSLFDLISSVFSLPGVEEPLPTAAPFIDQISNLISH